MKVNLSIAAAVRVLNVLCAVVCAFATANVGAQTPINPYQNAQQQQQQQQQAPSSSATPNAAQASPYTPYTPFGSQPAQRGIQGTQQPAQSAAGQPPSYAPSANPQQSTNAASLMSSDNLSAMMNAGAAPVGIYGEQLFRPGIPPTGPTGFNRDYIVAIGDYVTLRIWGAFTIDAPQMVDSQGNIFVPNVGPVHVSGVRNADLNTTVSSAVSRVYKANVGVYAALDASQPVKVFVTGFVKAPGQYAGAAGESVLGYLARAGGVDPLRGSYIDARLLRNGRERARFDLYRFLNDGELDRVQLQDGDTLVVGARHNAASVLGEVFNGYTFEFDGDRVDASKLISLARVKPDATHVSIVRGGGLTQFGEYYALDQLAGINVLPGDQLSVVSDRTMGTILVRIDGAQLGSRMVTLPYGSKLSEALKQLRPNSVADVDSTQLFRLSVAQRQKEMLEISLRSLETYALTARSSTSEEAQLRTQEAALILQFVQRARNTPMRGQVVLAGRDGMADTKLEDGDVIYVPERNSVILIHGEVTFPSAIVYDSRSKVGDYLRMAGGATQSADDRRILIAKPTGAFEFANLDDSLRPGDEIFVLPKITAKSIEITRSITQIIYQIAVAARIVFGL